MVMQFEIHIEVIEHQALVKELAGRAGLLVNLKWVIENLPNKSFFPLFTAYL